MSATDSDCEIKREIPSQRQGALGELRLRLIEMYTCDPMRRFNRLMASVSAVLLLAVTVLLPAVHLRNSEVFAAWLAPFLIATCAIWSQIVGWPRLRDACVLLFWVILTTICLGSLTCIVARTPAALVDLRLASIDHAIGLETSAVVHVAALHPHVEAVLAVIYSWMIPFALLALIVPMFQGVREPPQRLLIGYIAAALITDAIYAVFPAVGPWTVYKFAATEQQMLCQSTINLLKSPGPIVHNITTCGIVAFPSFHVILCILTATALWHSRWLRFPAAALAALMCISTVTTGWHYGIDVVGGGAVAILAHLSSGWIHDRFVKPNLRAAEVVEDPLCLAPESSPEQNTLV
jgi:membrane-associated phospholipid phosphatase